MTEENEDDWEVPLVDYYLMEMPEGVFPVRQANGVSLNIITCRDEPGRKVMALMLYSTALEAGMLLPLSPDIARNLAAAMTQEGEL